MFSQQNETYVEHASIHRSYKLPALVSECVLRILEAVFKSGVPLGSKKVFWRPSHLQVDASARAKVWKTASCEVFVSEHTKNGAVSNERRYQCLKAKQMPVC
jgi:hypothetical protein